MTGSVVVPALGYCLNGFILIWESLDNKYKPNQFEGPRWHDTFIKYYVHLSEIRIWYTGAIRICHYKLFSNIQLGVHPHACIIRVKFDNYNRPLTLLAFRQVEK